MRIRILGAHNIESRRTRLPGVLIDDILAVDAGGLTSSLSFRAQLRLKAVLITHPHYDHIRDLPALGMNAFLHEASLSVYSSQDVRDILVAHFMNGTVYPNFLERPPERPAIDFTVVKPRQPFTIDKYRVTALPLKHSLPTYGYEITSADGKSVFYTGDTGPGLSEVWQSISPRLLIIEITAPSRYEDFARESKHMTPGLLREELVEFRRLKGYLPSVVGVHVNPIDEEETRAEVAELAQSLNSSVMLAREGMRLEL